MAKDSAYKVDYKDSQLKAIDKEGNAAVKDSNSMFDSMIKQSDGYFQSQIDAVKDYGETQQKNQQAQTDQTIKEINQQKDQLHQDYLKEQTGAYVDWQKQSDQYGSNAEQMAASGLAHTGYSESSQVAMYNQYQNRVATARESYIRAKQNYDNSITQARLQNNSLLAEIAFNTLQTSLELSLQGFQYKNTLVQDKAAAAREIDNTYYSRYQDRISQINHENSMAEQIRQYNQDYKLKVKQYNESIRQFNVEIARLKAQDKKENEYKIKQLELQRAQLAEEKRQFNENLAWQKKKAELDSSGGGYLPDDEPEDGGGDDNMEPHSIPPKEQALNKLKAGQVKTYAQAQTLLKSLGIKGKAKVPMLDSITWQKAKKTGVLSSEFENIKTYGQYVERYCRYAINECM